MCTQSGYKGIHVSMNIPCLHVQISATPLPGYARTFHQYLQHTYVCIHVRWDVREALTLLSVWHLITGSHLCVCSTLTSDNAEDLSQYDPGCWTGCKTPTLTLLTLLSRHCVGHITMGIDLGCEATLCVPYLVSIPRCCVVSERVLAKKDVALYGVAHTLHNLLFLLQDSPRHLIKSRLLVEVNALWMLHSSRYYL